jgi:hypothetical protein
VDAGDGLALAYSVISTRHSALISRSVISLCRFAFCSLLASKDDDVQGGEDFVIEKLSKCATTAPQR